MPSTCRERTHRSACARPPAPTKARCRAPRTGRQRHCPLRSALGAGPRGRPWDTRAPWRPAAPLARRRRAGAAAYAQPGARQVGRPVHERRDVQHQHVHCFGVRRGARQRDRQRAPLLGALLPCAVLQAVLEAVLKTSLGQLRLPVVVLGLLRGAQPRPSARCARAAEDRPGLERAERAAPGPQRSPRRPRRREAAAPGGARHSPARRAASATAAPRGTAAPAGPAGSPSAAPGRTAQRAAARGLLVAERLARRARCTWPGACLLLTLATPGCATDLPHDLPSGSSHCCGLVKRLLNSACTACRRCECRAPAARSAPAQHRGDAWHSLCDHFSGVSASASPLVGRNPGGRHEPDGDSRGEML